MGLKFIDDGWLRAAAMTRLRGDRLCGIVRDPIINASWGGPQPSTVLDAAIDASEALAPGCRRERR
jgi:hypothetical protein